MTIYVDSLTAYPDEAVSKIAKRYGNVWCHMWTDGSVLELHAFAEKIGLSRSWFQVRPDGRFHHYDLTPAKRELAVKAGAVEISLKDWIRQQRGLKSPAQ